jgi:hypothetical protein
MLPRKGTLDERFDKAIKKLRYIELVHWTVPFVQIPLTIAITDPATWNASATAVLATNIVAILGLRHARGMVSSARLKAAVRSERKHSFLGGGF